MKERLPGYVHKCFLASGFDTEESIAYIYLFIYFIIYYLFIMHFEAGEPASKVCGQPVPTARNVQLYINYN